MYMTRTTLMLPPELRRKAFEEAHKLGISFGEFVRAAMRRALERAPKGDRVHDSFLDDKAVYKGPVPSDSSTNHDAYLYGDEP